MGKELVKQFGGGSLLVNDRSIYNYIRLFLSVYVSITRRKDRVDTL